ncbi:hypothetical protein HPP92_019774 [Vanilla planifolia]|uniref:Prolyl 4-hydroxylase alpha subunit domain-containing protein n=1 Tax=Vanilla planifolia TaxID=51239 RepID=A0A835Q7A8_VANPL|nr:hypothetical protein HPP92_020231 [Vanilla planifolia]KAG0465610.1 hypothetical protein HPP92_019774 [Vanilla planifolia]
MGRNQLVMGILTFVAVGMVIGSLFQLVFIHRMGDSSGASYWENDMEAAILRLGYVQPEVLSWSPRIILFHNFLSGEECDYLKGLARSQLHASYVADAITGKAITTDARTSSSMFLSSEERNLSIIQAIEKRIAVFSQVPVENGEFIQILRYEFDQFYNLHHDYFYDTANLKRGGQRSNNDYVFE